MRAGSDGIRRVRRDVRTRGNPRPPRAPVRRAPRLRPTRSCPGRRMVLTTPQSTHRRCTMNIPCPPGRPARCGFRGVGCPAPRSATSMRSTLLSQEMRSSSGPSACRQALVTSSETTSRTSSAAARRSAVSAGIQPHACSASRVKSRARGTMPAAPTRFSLRLWCPAARPTSTGDRPGVPPVSCGGFRLRAAVARRVRPGGAHQHFTSPRLLTCDVWKRSAVAAWSGVGPSMSPARPIRENTHLFGMAGVTLVTPRSRRDN